MKARRPYTTRQLSGEAASPAAEVKTCIYINEWYIQQRVASAVNNMRQTGSTSRWMMAPMRLPSAGKVP